MSLTLAQINLGTAPAGKDGDTQRTANSKTNDNMTAIAAAVNSLSSGKADTSVTDGLRTDVTALQTSVGSLNSANAAQIGGVMFFARNTAPQGYLKANGAAVSRTTYAALFTAIGTTFGAGDGTTTFNLPDLRGEFPRGWDDGRGIDAGRAFGSAQGASVHPWLGVYRASATSGILVGLPAATLPDGGQAYPSGESILPASTGPYFSTTLPAGSTNTAPAAIGARPRNVALLACIRYA